ncbi:helix-turn-helix domain-containing protein [Fredinandcohnia sp. 179-A 10B2 NHS]|uniref:helix-turn-helix domain-containing protein n=1 Tax=Fredinandcohnia sp. 179-A 10B2 NHS TaxID=3235176 RepID=UPI0039A081FE
MKTTKEYSTWESLPDTLTAMHISEFLGISRRRVYELFQIQVDKGGIPHFRIGASKRVEKEDFRQWVTQLKNRNRKIIS